MAKEVSRLEELGYELMLYSLLVIAAGFAWEWGLYAVYYFFHVKIGYGIIGAMSTVLTVAGVAMFAVSIVLVFAGIATTAKRVMARKA